MDILRKIDINVMAINVASKIDTHDFHEVVVKPMFERLKTVDEEIYFTKALNECLEIDNKEINKFQERFNFNGEK